MVRPMVDVTYVFVVLLGGGLVGLVSGLVRKRGFTGTLAEVVVGDACGIIAGNAVIHYPILATIANALLGPDAINRPEIAFLASDLVYLSPVIGGFIGVGLVAFVRRFVLGLRRDVSWGYLLGELLKIIGYVLGIIALVLIVATLALMAKLGAPQGFEPIMLLNDLVLPALFIASGWALMRVFRRAA